MSNYDFLIKCILIGDSGVGKSCLLRQFLESLFQPYIEPTIGIEFGSKLLTVKDSVVRLQIWDSAGQENYRSITRSYYRNTSCALLVYDITSRRTFESLNNWLEDARNFGNGAMRFVLVGNKADSEGERQVRREEGEEFARANAMLFFEVSAKETLNVSKMFELLVENVLAAINAGQIDPYNEMSGVKIGLSIARQNAVPSQPDRKGCC